MGTNISVSSRDMGKVINGQFTMKRVAYVKGLKHNLSRLVVGTGNQVLFNEKGVKFQTKKQRKSLLKLKSKGDMFTLDMKPIVSIPSVCLLLKASSDHSLL